MSLRKLFVTVTLLVLAASACVSGDRSSAQAQAGPVPAAQSSQAAPPARGERPVPPDDPPRGMVHRDLVPGRAGGPCEGGFEIGNSGNHRRCYPGPDPAP